MHVFAGGGGGDLRPGGSSPRPSGKDCGPTFRLRITGCGGPCTQLGSETIFSTWILCCVLLLEVGTNGASRPLTEFSVYTLLRISWP